MQYSARTVARRKRGGLTLTDRPRLTALLLADHAEAVNGKLYVTGGCWNLISAAAVPVRHWHMSLALALEIPWIAANEKHSIQVELFDSDRVGILSKKPEGEFEVGRPPGARPGDTAMVVLVFNFNGIELPRAGWYSFVVSVDGKELGDVKFKVQVVESPATQA